MTLSTSTTAAFVKKCLADTSLPNLKRMIFFNMPQVVASGALGEVAFSPTHDATKTDIIKHLGQLLKSVVALGDAAFLRSFIEALYDSVCDDEDLVNAVSEVWFSLWPVPEVAAAASFYAARAFEAARVEAARLAELTAGDEEWCLSDDDCDM